MDDGKCHSDSLRVCKLRILLPNGMTVLVKIPQGTDFITVRELANKVKEQHDIHRASNPKKKSVKWDADLCFIDDYDYVFRNCLKLTRLEPNRVYYLRLDDGSPPATIYENMWDLTPDTELLMELPEEYTFETALADLIDNSLEAVWANDEGDKRLISVEVSDKKISIFDTGPGLDPVSIEKWGKMRAHKIQGIGDKPPYLKPDFGMFGFGGFIASLHLGRRTELSSKTKIGKKVYILRLERDPLVSGSVSGSKATWRTYGGLRDPTNDELELSPGGSFTKVEIFEPKMRSINIRRLKCKLKDVYFPYIQVCWLMHNTYKIQYCNLAGSYLQCDDLSKNGRTIMPIEFQVNGDDLAEIPGGEVEITNLASCNGPEFILQVCFKSNHDNAAMTSSQGLFLFLALLNLLTQKISHGISSFHFPGTRPTNEASARIRCMYLPVKEGKESVESLIEGLKEDGYDYKEDFESFRHVSCRRLGRLLPDARWTDLAHQNDFTTALRNLGNKQPFEKDSGVDIDIKRDGKSLNLTQLDKEYQLWLMEMHEKYDEEVDSRFDEPVLTRNPSSIEILNTRQCRELGIESSLPDEPEIIAVVRPGTYKSGIPSKHLDQKYVMKDNFEMSLIITYSTNKNPQDEHTFYSGSVAPSSLRDFHGLYVFKPRCTPHPLFQNPGIFTFTFSIGDSSCEKRVVKVPVKASCEMGTC
ncbi:putative histidine kinase/HSP90-like ATPase superfamily [Helianthus annuus]|nr:putative histidine kinase/HSP90-like ATPase superfamily [Helianthus annuus]KAJ0722475.1 putative histidine kinase/HSP90-like ATPase superfamily [Helianthus annuus]